MRVEVIDGNPAPPRRRATGPGIPGGHGIPILERITARWGSASERGGKTVWADVPTGLP